MSNTGPPPVSGGDNRNLGPIVVGINWMVFGPATVMVALRLITRKWITHNFGWDDVTILLAQVSETPQSQKKKKKKKKNTNTNKYLR